MSLFVLADDDFTPGADPLNAWCLGTNYRIVEVNGRSFYTYRSAAVSGPGTRERFLLAEWLPWLAARFAEGHVWLRQERARVVAGPGWAPTCQVFNDRSKFLLG